MSKAKAVTAKKTEKSPAARRPDSGARRKEPGARAAPKPAPDKPAATAAAHPAKPQAKKAAREAPSGGAGSARLGREEQRSFRDLLISLREKVTGQINFLADESLNRPGYDVPDDNGDDFEKESALNLVQSEHDVVIEIDEALRRLQDGSYGRCEECTQPIERARLKALPFTRLCIRCKSATEKGHRPFRTLGSAGSFSSAGRKTEEGAAEPEEEPEE